MKSSFAKASRSCDVVSKQHFAITLQQSEGRTTAARMRRRTLVMNRTLALAAVLAAFTFIVHLVVGTGEIAAPLFASALPPEIRYLLYACWHLVSCALALSAVALWMGARAGAAAGTRAMVVFVSVMWLTFGAVFIAVGLGAGMLFTLPQWTLLLPVGALGLWGARRTVFV